MIGNTNNLIYILVDIDADGYYSASIIYKYLKVLNKDLNVKPLFHKTKKHGLNDKDVMDTILKNQPVLVICPDSASQDFKQHKILKDHNISVLVLDHHPCNKYSEDAIVINNKLSHKVENKDGSGCLVTWKFLKYLDKKLNKNIASKMYDVVYFSLIADNCKMNSIENRIFSYFTCRSSISNKFLKRIVKEFQRDNDALNNEFITWTIQPKISAIIRSDKEDIKTSLFFALANENENDIEEVIKNCKSIHSKQQNFVKNYVADMLDNIDESRNIIFEETYDLNPFYKGLVAARIGNVFNKPVILYNESTNNFTGSIRSPYPIKDKFIKSNLFSLVAGHDEAFGIEFDLSHWEEILNFVENCEINKERKVVKSYNASKLNNNIFGISDKYKELWGQGIPKPLFHIHNIKINGKDIQAIGNGSTVKFSYKGIDYIKFFCTKEQKKAFYIGENQELIIQLIGDLTYNEWNGIIKKQVKIEYIEVSLPNNDIEWDDLF